MTYTPCIKKYFQNFQDYKGKTHPKFTTEIGSLCNTASRQVHGKQSIPHFGRNTTTDYAPNWCSGQEIYLQLDAVQPLAL